MWIFIGLGNPGSKYEKTRHNLGFMAVDRIAGTGDWKEQHKALVQKIVLDGHTVILAKPQTFMNLSGESVQALLSWHKVPVDHLVVFSDDIALDCGRIRIRPQGSHGGQNGLRSIIEKIGDGFARVRLGAGKPPAGWDTADWVLSKISAEDQPLCQQALAKIPEVCGSILKSGVTATMGKYNGPN
jgi:PTH1 family peptidyl-tRNA hydrolase